MAPVDTRVDHGYYHCGVTHFDAPCLPDAALVGQHGIIGKALEKLLGLQRSQHLTVQIERLSAGTSWLASAMLAME